jgi:hypothetical protein
MTRAGKIELIETANAIANNPGPDAMPKLVNIAKKCGFELKEEPGAQAFVDAPQTMVNARPDQIGGIVFAYMAGIPPNREAASPIAQLLCMYLQGVKTEG